MEEHPLSYNLARGKIRDGDLLLFRPRPGLFGRLIAKAGRSKYSHGGSTLIACEQTGRTCYTMEIDRPYCDVVIDRFQRFTSTPAILERTGTSPLPMRPREVEMR